MAGARAGRLATLAVALALAGCTRSAVSPGAGASGSPTARPSAAPAFPTTVTDDDGVPVTFASEPQRIITWAPSNTEILFAVGLGSRVVGVSGSFDNYPAAATSIPSVGGEGGVTPNVEKVVSLHADLVLNGFEGGGDWKAQLRRLGVPVFSIYATTLDDAMHDIRTVGSITGAAAAADRLVGQMSNTVDAVVAAVSTEPPVSCFFESYYPPLTSVGPDTFMFDILKKAGCEPVTGSAKSDYPEWSVDQLVQQSPQDYIAVSESARSVAAVAKRPGFAAIGAVEQGHVFLVSSDLITRPDPRVVQALADLAHDLHPEAFN